MADKSFEVRHGLNVANGILVVSNSAIEVVANLQLSTATRISLNGSTGTNGQVIASNGTSEYWTDIASLGTGVPGANQQVIFNDSSAFGTNTEWLFDKLTTTQTMGSGTSNLTANATMLRIRSADGSANLQPTQLVIGATIVNSSTVNATSHVAGANVVLNTTGLSIGNSTVNTAANSTSLQTAVIAVSANVSVGSNVLLLATGLYVGNSTANSLVTSIESRVQSSLGAVIVSPQQVQVGANVILHQTYLFLGNSTVNSTLQSTVLSIANSSGRANLQPTGLVVGGTTVNSTWVNTTGVGVGANIFVNTTTLSIIGNSSVNSYSNAELFLLRTETVFMTLRASGMTVGNTIVNATSVSTEGLMLNAATVAVRTGNYVKFSASDDATRIFLGNTADPVAYVSANQFILRTSANVNFATFSTSGLVLGNSTVNSTVNSSGIYIANSSYSGLQGIGKQTIWIPASAITLKSTLGSGELTANSTTVSYVAYDATSVEDGTFSIAMPKGWNEGTVSFQAYWAHPATATNFGVVWQMFIVPYGDSDLIDGISYSGPVNSVDTGGTTNDLYISPESSALTITGAAENDMLNIIIRRLASDGSDTLAVDAYLLGVKIFYTTNTFTDQ